MRALPAQDINRKIRQMKDTTIKEKWKYMLQSSEVFHNQQKKCKQKKLTQIRYGKKPGTFKHNENTQEKY